MQHGEDLVIKKGEETSEETEMNKKVKENLSKERKWRDREDKWWEQITKTHKLILFLEIPKRDDVKGNQTVKSISLNFQR